MQAVSPLRSAATRLAMVYMALFVGASLAVNVFAYRMVMQFLDDRVNSSVMERYREIASAFEEGGTAGAVKMIESHGPAIKAQETLYSLSDPKGQMIAGNTKLSDVRPGFSILQPSDQHGSRSHYKLFSAQLGKDTLTVGISYDNVKDLATVILVNFGFATVIIISIGMIGSVVLARRNRSRLLSLTRVAHAIGDGELSKRLPVSPRMDEIDILATEVNVAFKRLDLSVSALKQVSADIAHDLRTPITRTFLALEDAANAVSADEMREGIEEAQGELRLITGTFDALLRIVQIEARSRTAKFALFDVGAIALEIFDIYELVAFDGHRHLSIDADRGPYIILGDTDLVRQLLVNLLENALRHTPTGSQIQIIITHDGTSVSLTVADNGPGIPSENFGRVFDRFYRGDPSRTTVGSGLGLSLVKAIADLHDARIELADNRPGLIATIQFLATSKRAEYFGVQPN